MSNTDSSILTDIPTISEYIKGVLLNSDGTYIVKKSKTLKQLMSYFMLWWKLVLSLVLTSDNTDETKVEQNKKDASTLDLVASLAKSTTIDYLGHVTRKGMTCPECGKKVSSLKSGGFCSTECAIKYVTKMASPFLLTPNQLYKEFYDVLDKINKLLDHTTLILNALASIPNIIEELSEIPEPYKSYVQLKINEGFCLLYACINKLMIKKSELIKGLLKLIKFGIIKKPIKTLFSAITTLLNLIDASKEVFDAAYKTVLTAILNLSKIEGPTIDAESMSLMATPHSYITTLPYTNPDKGKLFISLPGGSGKSALANVKTTMPSALLNIDFEKIDSMVKSLFPPLFACDYYLDPEAFDARYLLSDLSNIALLIRLQLEDLLTFQYDYLPKFENMFPTKKTTYNISGENVDIWTPNIAYIWFLLGLLDGWAPHSQALVGSLLNPTI